MHNPMQYSIKNLAKLYKQCNVSTKKLMTESPWMRKEFLVSQLRESMEDEGVDEATRHEEFLRNEAPKKVWASIQLGTPIDKEPKSNKGQSSTE